ncbi:siderophore-interacting protein [Amycolatopsis pithecellobii]|uniref:Siderophore-interacting protein n=1 Tax=Amycolatopsis pithecellobii TaxID=664692 RepID=A0A6N7YPY6_9PSEU|nr:siderophore-interacting protein [Amycolatopsis pithecellobii]MTD54062.1 siderophore-interacting protein [Amycolatopsis pithecellobii]
MSITLAGKDFQHLEQVGYDQWGRLFFAGPGQREVALPSSERWMLQQAVQSGKRRARVRSYSIRRFRPEMSAFDIEISVHEEHDAGPGAAWAQAAEPGDVVAFLDEGCGYLPTTDAAWQLLVGDESALPAVLAIAEQSAGALSTEVFLEVPDSEDVRDIAAPPNTKIHWLPRNDSAMKPGTLALRAVRDAELSGGPFYTWVAGESALATGVRRHLVNDRGVPKPDITFRGYWRHGRASLG